MRPGIGGCPWTMFLRFLFYIIKLIYAGTCGTVPRDTSSGLTRRFLSPVGPGPRRNFTGLFWHGCPADRARPGKKIAELSRPLRIPVWNCDEKKIKFDSDSKCSIVKTLFPRLNYDVPGNHIFENWTRNLSFKTEFRSRFLKKIWEICRTSINFVQMLSKS